MHFKITNSQIWLVMKISVFRLFVALLQLHAHSSYSQETKMNFEASSICLKQLFNDIEKQSEFLFFYVDADVEGVDVSVNARNATIMTILNQALSKTLLTYEINDRYITIAPKGIAKRAQGIMISGTITDETGMPMPGVNVVIKGTSNGVVTGSNGSYSIIVPDKDVVLIFSFIGYTSQEIWVGEQRTINTVLLEDVRQLDEVVVVGYGTQKKVNLTGAVSSIRQGDLGDVQTNSVSSMIKGHLSGVQITQNNGKPGSSSTIRIRGVGTLNAGAIDGDTKNDPLLVVDGQAVDYGIETIDPNDIESVSVLKDASSAAIYGARAANGVVLITTKRGIKGQGKLNVNAYYSVQSLVKDYNLLNAEQFVMLQNEARTNAGMTSMFLNEPSYYGKGTDWVKEVTSTASIQEYNINFSKGTDQSNYYMSGTYYNQDGVVNNTGYNRGSFRFNGDTKVLTNLKVGNSITLTRNETHGNPVSLGNAVIIAPTIPVRFDDGSWGAGKESGEGNPANPAYISELCKDHKVTMWRVLANLYAEYQILKELRFKVTGAIDYASQNDKRYYPKVTVFGDYLDFTDQQLVDNMSGGYTWQNDYLLYFNKDWNKHHLDAMAGVSLQASEKKSNNSSVKGFLNDSEYLQVLSAGQRDWRNSGTIQRWSMLSYFGNINYVYDSRYLASFNMRVDGSSRFGKNNKYGYFPSGSLAWRISQEEFMNGIGWLSNLKLRASYGSLGNQEIGLYSFAEQLNINQWYLFGAATDRSPGVSSIQLVDPDIKWETTTITNFGVDVGVLNNTLSLVAEYYIKNTRDILLSYPVPSTVGKTSPTVNAGKVRNQGVELELKYNNTFGDLWLNVAVIYAYNKNEVRSLIGDQDFITHNYSNNITARSQVGHPINSIYGYVFDGIYQTQEEISNSPKWSKAELGVLKFKDLNDDDEITSQDMTFIANPMPTSTFGVNVSMKYKSWDFAMFWQGELGKDLYWGYFGGMFPMNGLRNVNELWLDRWTGAGSTNSMPKVKYNLNYDDVSSWDIKKADYFRLKNLSIGYTFKIKNIMSARVYVAGQNLLTFTSYPGFDPEIKGIANFNAWGDSYPQARSYTVGLNLNF